MIEVVRSNRSIVLVAPVGNVGELLGTLTSVEMPPQKFSRGPFNMLMVYSLAWWLAVAGALAKRNT